MKTGYKKGLYIFLGTLCLLLGALGLFLPVLPTTPFWLLTAYLYLNSSPRLYNKVMTIPVFGESVRNFRLYRAIPLRAKITSVTILWLTTLLSVYLVWNIWVTILLPVISIAVTWHILSYKTLHKNK